MNLNTKGRKNSYSLLKCCEEFAITNSAVYYKATMKHGI